MFQQFTLLATNVIKRIGCGFFLAVLCFATTLQSAEKPDLSGVVKDEAGKPLPGATIFIYTAAPKDGPGVLCPSCYDDCRKRATADANGNFKITELDSSLTFKLLVVSKGHQPEFVKQVDPAEKPVEVSLKPVSTGSFPKMRFRGKVVDLQGEPIRGAVVSVNGIGRGSGITYGSSVGVDRVAVSDEDGTFTLFASSPFDFLNLDVEARSFAKAKFNGLASGDEEHLLKMGEGISVTGRVLKGGKPLSGIEVGMSGAERRSEVYIGNFSVATSGEGRFLFVNIPPGYAYQFYGIMKSLRDAGTIPSRVIRSGGHGTALDLGDIELEPGLVIAGQVKLRDGKPVTEKTRLLLSRQEAWDSQQTETDSEGRFRFVGVPAEGVGLSARADGFRLSARNASLDPLNPYHLIGRVATNKVDLVIELEPGSRSLERLDGNQTLVRNEPLRGVETVAPNPGDIKVTGSVIDAETKKPLAEFTITPGLEDQFSRGAEWRSNRKAAHKNGEFTSWFTPQSQALVLLVEAKGYLPQASAPIKTTETNLVFELQKGIGYSGVVRLPDGRPAAAVHVYLTDMRNGIYIAENGRVRSELFRGTKSIQTDATGRFFFDPKVDAFSICVQEPTGFAEVRIEDFLKNPVVQMKKLAKVEGKLLIGTRPGSNEVVRLGLSYVPYRYHPRSFAPISLFMTTTTKADGTFVFDYIPPVPVEISHSPKVKDQRMGTIPVSQGNSFVLKPGEVRRLTLGGQGRPVIGKFVIDGYDENIDWRSDVQSMELVLPEPEGVPSLNAMSQEFAKSARASKKEDYAKLREEFDKTRNLAITKLAEYYQSDAGMAYHFQKKRYALNFQQDGSFRVEDVPAGKYTINFELREKSGDRYSPMGGSRIASIRKDIEVPAIPGGRSDEPLDIGIIEVRARGSMKAGKIAPEFAVKTLYDKPLKLADFKGKYVLLDFWAVWCGPCVAETPHLKEAYELIKDNPKFAMIGLSLDPDMEAPIEYAKKNKIGWIQGFLGDWSKTDLPNQYGVQGIPSIMLIGPDGKIVASGLRGPAIKSALQGVINR